MIEIEISNVGYMYGYRYIKSVSTYHRTHIPPNGDILFRYIRGAFTATTATRYHFTNNLTTLTSKIFHNFGGILDEILNELDLKQVELSKKYRIDKTSISTDRRFHMTRRRMLKYKKFIKAHGINEEFFTKGIYPILVEEPSNKDSGNDQNTVAGLKDEVIELRAIIAEKDKQITMLKEALHLAISASRRRGKKDDLK